MFRLEMELTAVDPLRINLTTDGTTPVDTTGVSARLSVETEVGVYRDFMGTAEGNGFLFDISTLSGFVVPGAYAAIFYLSWAPDEWRRLMDGQLVFERGREWPSQS